MGSFERKMRRNEQRKAFKVFSKEWREAKESGYLVNGKELGKKPSLNLFVKRVAERAEYIKNELEKKQAEKLENEKKLDLEWKEG